VFFDVRGVFGVRDVFGVRGVFCARDVRSVFLFATFLTFMSLVMFWPFGRCIFGG